MSFLPETATIVLDVFLGVMLIIMWVIMPYAMKIDTERSYNILSVRREDA